VQKDDQRASRSASIHPKLRSAVPKQVVREVASEPEKEVSRHRETLSERFQQELSSTSRGSHSDEGPIDGFANWFYSQRAYPTNSIPADARYKALQSAILHNGGLHGAPGGAASPDTPALPTWVSLGPSTIPDGQTDTTVGPANPVSGRVAAIAVSPADPNTVYVGGAQGGVWKTTNALSATPTWTPLTDQQASLAIGDIAIDPVDPNIIYVGTGEPNGSCDSYYGKGILRSADGGTTWILLGAGSGGPFNNQSISKILIDPVTAGSTTSTTLWASTALGFLSSGTEQCIVAPGGWNGAVWRSSDSGATWVLQDVPTGAAAPNARIHDMALDPTDSDILYVAVRSVPTAANGGIWKSVDATAATPSFTKLAGGFPSTVSAVPGIRRISLGIGGSAAPGTLYAALESVSGSALWGLYKTTDGGTTWSHVEAASGTATLSGTTLTATAGAFATDGSWISRRIILSNFASARIASVTDSTHLILSGLSGSGAFTWSTGSYPAYCSGQCFYDMTIGVDPTDGAAATVYVGGNPHAFANSGPLGSSHYVWLSTDGGAIWTPISQGNATTGGLHTDDHEIAFDTSTTPARVYDGNDGGIWRSDDQGASWVTMNTNIAITQFQGVSLHPSDPNIVLGGTQDNGSNIQNPAFQPVPKWFHADFGDGGQSLIDQSTPSRMFHTYFNQSFNFYGPAKSTIGGAGGPGSWDFVGCYFGYGSYYYNGMDPTDPVSFYAPIAEHPAFTPNVVYFGSNKLYRSPDPQPPFGVTSWTPKSPALTKGGGAFLSWIGVLPNASGSEVIYTGASDGRVEVSSDVDGTAGLATWTVIDNASLPNRFVTSIEVASSDATGNTAYVGFSGFNATAPAGHLFRTTDGLSGAATWTDLSGDLPDIPVNAIAVDPTQTPSILYVGTDIGVFQSLDDGAHWSYISTGHPVVSVFGLQRNPTTGQIVSSTHGRGMFQLISNGLPDTTPPICGGSVADANTFNGTALDAGANDTGVASIALQGGAANLFISSINYSSPGSATYVVNTVNHCLAGSGTVVVTDYAGNICNEAVALTGDPVPPAPTASNTGPYCVGQTIQLNASTVGGATYAWTGPNGFTSSDQNPTIPNATAAAAGSYSVTATVGGCASAAGSTNVVVNPLPTPVVIPNDSTTFCAGGSVTLDAGAGYSSYLWSPGGQTTRTIVVSTSGSYTVTVTAATGCQGTSAPTVVTVNPNPAPVVTVSHCAPPNTSGLTASAPPNAGDTYTWTITGGTIDSGQGTDAISFTSGGPGTPMSLSVVETTAASCAGTANDTMQVDFNDVPTSDAFYSFICSIGRDGITAGCGGGNYCPGNSVTRAQMAVFLLKGEHGSSYVPPPATGTVFADVPANAFAAAWIEELSAEGIAAGCGGGNYCPDNPVTRAQMAIFLLVAEHGSGYTPPTCTGIFQDVACTPTKAFAVDWIEQLSAEGVTGGCGGGNYCPDDPNTRGQMAVFLVETFNLP